MKTQTEEKVIAIESFKNGILKKYGEGILIPNQIPDIQPFKKAGAKNPYIKLDNGKYVWGFQCWWSSLKRFEKEYSEHIKETIIVDVEDEIKPLTPKQIKQH